MAATLTNLESKVGEVLGLAMAAKGSTQKLRKLVDDERLRAELERMRDEAAETERRCKEVAATFDGKKSAILGKARETKGEATEMMETYLGDDADGLDAFEFLTMAEAGEVGHWRIVAKLNERAGHRELGKLVDWAIPVQERHFETVVRGALKLAAQEDPAEES